MRHNPPLNPVANGGGASAELPPVSAQDALAAAYPELFNRSMRRARKAVGGRR